MNDEMLDRPCDRENDLNSTSPEISEGERIYPYITVCFKGNRRVTFSNPMEFPFEVGDYAVVRVEKGEDLGKVAHLLEKLPDNHPAPEHEVLRRATQKDLRTLAEYRAREGEARSICKEKIQQHGLQMKLVDVEYQFDGRKLIFYFTADGRIDFRQLVKDLAATFRTRIELRQIGARDETKRYGGLGPCGRELCCASYLREFAPIGTQMAKDQNLPLSPSKISGCCNRLKCCLQHELNVYREALKVLPRWDTRLQTAKGPAVVEKLDVFNHVVYLRYASGDLERVEEKDLERVLSGAPPEPPDEGTVDGSETVSDSNGAGFPDKQPKTVRRQDKRHRPAAKSHPKRPGKRKKNHRNRPRKKINPDQGS